MSLSKKYEGCSKSSEIYLIALSRDSFERHAMRHLKELSFSLQMMLISPRCIVTLNSYGILYISPTPYHWPVFMLYNYYHFWI